MLSSGARLSVARAIDKEVEMPLKPLTFVLSLASVVALGLSACGADEPATTTVPRLTKAQYVARADAICTRTTHALEAAGGQVSPGTTEAAFVERDVAPIFRKAVRSLAALRPPAGDEPAVRAIVQAGNHALARVEADPESLKAPPGSAQDPFREFGRRAAAYGIRCGG